MRLTPDDVHHDPVRGGVGGHAGVVAAGAGAGVGHRQPALETGDNDGHSNKVYCIENGSFVDKSFEMRSQLT